MPMQSLKAASVLLNTPTLKRRVPLNMMMMPDSSGGLKNKLVKNTDGEISENQMDEKKELTKRILLGPLPMIPENKPT